MINIEEVQGVIFDVDDTLLDNQADVGTLHELSRFKALQVVAEKYELPSLTTLTHQEDLDAFRNAKSHSVEGAVWGILLMKGIVSSDDIDYDHPLLKEIVVLKDDLHADILRAHGRAVVGAVELAHWLGKDRGLSENMGIASSAVGRDIDIFLDEMTDLRQFFPATRVVSKEHIPVGLGKPNPEPFHRAFQALGLSDDQRQNTLALEDDPRGVVSAKAAGLVVGAITTRYAADHPALIASQPDIIIDHYPDFMHQLQTTGQYHAPNSSFYYRQPTQS